MFISIGIYGAENAFFYSPDVVFSSYDDAYSFIYSNYDEPLTEKTSLGVGFYLLKNRQIIKTQHIFSIKNKKELFKSTNLILFVFEHNTLDDKIHQAEVDYHVDEINSSIFCYFDDSDFDSHIIMNPPITPCI